MVNLLALGPIELWNEGRQYRLGSRKERCVLAVLLHARGEPVPLDTIMTCVWGDGEWPSNSVGNTRTYLSRLKSRLKAAGEAARLERPSHQRYRLSVAPDRLDLTCFQQLRVRARAKADRGEGEAAVGLLRAAEALWRGEPLAEFTGDWAASTRARLNEDLLRVKEERIRLELERGRHADLIGELHELVARNPLAQQAVGSLMLALYRSGRHAESLDEYRAMYRRLDKRLGMRPGAELQRLNRQIIEQDPALGRDAELPTASAAPVPAPVGKPAAGARPGAAGNLPRDTGDFTGRTSELAILLADTRRSGSGSSSSSSSSSSSGSRSRSADDDDGVTAMPVTVLYGMPGIGKTATAVRAAYRMRERYPDGQFYVDLRGYSDQSRCEPHEALASLLRSSGATTELPDSLDERAARWREWTARHRALVVLDNARATPQVTPLLPGAPTCRAIVTSRNRLAGLDGATPVFLDVLSQNEGMDLFTRIAGASRTTDRTALRRVVNACSCHPLALQLLAGRYRHRDSWDLGHLLDRLSEAQDPLSEFDDALASAFQLSYAELDGPARRLFRCLALHPGPDITLGAAAALLGSDTAKARQSMEGLLDAHMLGEAALDRFQLHDLLRAFSVQTGRRDEPESVRRASVHRLLTYYLGSADRADRLTHPRRRRLPAGDGPDLPPDGAETFADADEASVWLDVERANLLAAADTAAAEVPYCAAYFAHVLAASLKSWGAWDAAGRLHAAAVRVRRECANRRGLAQALTEQADILAKGAPGEAQRCATEALEVFEELTDVEGCADALFQLGRAQLAAGHGVLCREALARALPLYREAGNRHGEAEALNVRGVALHLAGERTEAEACFLAMHGIHEQLGDVRGQVRSLNNLGEIHRLAGRHGEARAHYERSLVLLQRIGGRQERANLYSNLGNVCQAAGETGQALSYFHQALSSYRISHDALGESDTLISLGAACAESERYNEALWHYTRAEQLARSIGNPDTQQRALIGIGAVQRRLGRYDLAEESCNRALDLSREAGIPLGVAQALDGLANIARMTKGTGAARSLAAEAAQLYESLGETERAAALRTGLVTGEVTGS